MTEIERLCAVSQMRSPAFAAKAKKDLIQAECLFRVLATDRPGDIALAAEAAEHMGKQFLRRFRAGLDQLGERTREEVLARV